MLKGIILIHISLCVTKSHNESNNNQILKINEKKQEHSRTIKLWTLCEHVFPWQRSWLWPWVCILIMLKWLHGYSFDCVLNLIVFIHFVVRAGPHTLLTDCDLRLILLHLVAVSCLLWSDKKLVAGILSHCVYLGLDVKCIH